MTPHGVPSDGQTMFFEYEVDHGRWTWSRGLRELHGLSPDEEPTTEVILRRMVQEDRPEMLARFRRHLVEAGRYSCVYRMTDAQDRLRRVVFVGESESAAGAVKRLSGFVVDVTEPFREGAHAAVVASAEHRARIEQAKGALMITFGVDEDVAFDLLRAYSSRHNFKLARLAERIMAGISDPSFSREEPARSLLDIVIGLGDVGTTTAGAAGSGALVRGLEGLNREKA